MFTDHSRHSFPPQKELAEEYESALDELTFNSKPLINHLTIIAGENIHGSETIVSIIQRRIAEAPDELKIFFLYLMDSIIKNIGHPYIEIFERNIATTFYQAFKRVDQRTQSSMLKLLGTWPPLFPSAVPQIQNMLKELHTAEQSYHRPRNFGEQLVRRGGLVVDSRYLAPMSNQQIEKVTPRKEPIPQNRIDHILSHREDSIPIRINANVVAPREEIYHRKRRVEPTFHTSRSQRPRIYPEYGAPVTAVPSFVDTQNTTYFPSDQQDILSHTQSVLKQLEHQIRVQLQAHKLTHQEQSELIKQLAQLETLKQQAHQLSGASTFSGEYPMVAPTFNGEGHINMSKQVLDNQAILQKVASSMGSSTIPPSAPHPFSATTFSHPTTIKDIIPPPVPVPSTTQPLVPEDLLKNLTQMGLLLPVTSPVPAASLHNIASTTTKTSSIVSTPASNIAPVISSSSTTTTTSSSTSSSSSSLSIPKLSSSTSRSSQRSIPGVVKSLYGLPLQCTTCGLRFGDAEAMGKHLDWHFSMNKKEQQKAKRAMSRSWFLSTEEWLRGDEVKTASATPFFGLNESEPEESIIEQNSIANDNQPACVVCGDKFEKFWDSDSEEWLYRGTVHNAENKIVHTACYNL